MRHFSQGRAVCRECRAEAERDRRREWAAERKRAEKPTAEDLLAVENPYVPPAEWRRRVEIWSQVDKWHRALYRHPHWPPNPEGGPLEELRARVDERWLREVVIPSREKHRARDSVS